MFALLLLLTADPPTPDPKSLIHSALVQQEVQEKQAVQFTHKIESINYKVDKNGQEKAGDTKVYDVIVLEGGPYKKLISINGAPPEAKQQKKIDEDLERERENRRRNGLLHKSIHVSSLGDLERFYTSKLAGEEIISGRKTWRVEFDPLADLHPADKHEAELLGERQTVWFDQADGAIVQKRAELLREVNDIGTGSVFLDRYSKMGDFWLLEEEDIHASLKIAVARLKIHSHHRHFDYKRFRTESEFKPLP